jgi:hypothetical protein
MVVVGAGAALWPKLRQSVFGQVGMKPEVVEQLREYNRHFGEQPGSERELFNDEHGRMAVAYYRTDGCLLVSRRGPGPNAATVPFWIRAVNIRRETPPDGLANARPANPDDAPRLMFAAFHPGDGDGPRFTPVRSGSCSGHCLNPHAGEFKTWNGETKDCWLQVWRQWPDGCTHYQWFNTCGSYWDADANGPRVTWTCCRH